MTSDKEPFWEALYRQADAETWGPPAEDVVDVIARIPPASLVLDVGCGDGRNALFLAQRGFRVRAFDISEPGIRKLERRAEAKGLSVEAWVGDLADFAFDREYGLVLMIGALQFADADLGDRFLASAREHTLPGGAHVHTVFTDVLEPPEDLAPFIRRLFGDGEIRDRYRDWEIDLFRSYIKEDEHPGGVHHTHAINDLVARRPASPHTRRQ